MTKEDGTIIAYPRIVKYTFFSVLSLAFALASLLLTLIGFKLGFGFINTTIKEGYSYAFVAFIGIAGLMIFFPMTFFFTKRLIIRKPSLIVNDNGIYDNTNYTSAGHISWSEIETTRIYKQVYYYIFIIGMEDSYFQQITKC